MIHHLVAPARRLAWDTDFFGFPVAAVEDPELPDDALASVLTSCRQAGIVLAYWNASAGRAVPAELLREHGGVRLERRLTFSRTLGDTPDEPLAVPIEELPHGSASDELLALAIVAGGHSRFRVDPRVPPGKFEELYRCWIDRSCRGDLADAVLVARAAGRIAGMITVSLEHEGAARIGLVAVGEEERGRGIGRALLHAAHRFMKAHGARLSLVVTQAANGEACGLYSRAGYAVSEERDGYHFWLTSPPA